VTGIGVEVWRDNVGEYACVVEQLELNYMWSFSKRCTDHPKVANVSHPSKFFHTIFSGFRLRCSNKVIISM
jgi:hypothetical protein